MIWVGDDWPEDHHDVEIQHEDGRRLARAQCPKGLERLTRLHPLIVEHLPASWTDLDPAEASGRVRFGIETDRGMWVQALLAAGYRVYAIKGDVGGPVSGTALHSGAKSDGGDAHVLAEIVRLDHAHHRQVAGDTPAAEAVKVAGPGASEPDLGSHPAGAALRSALRGSSPPRCRRSTIWPPARHSSCWTGHPIRTRLPRLTIVAALRRAGRRDLEGRATAIGHILNAEQLRQPRAIQTAYAAIVSSRVQLINILNVEIGELGQVVADHSGRHRDADRLLCLPGLGVVLDARILGKFGDDPHRYTDGKSQTQLHRHLTDHSGVGQPRGRAGPLRPQPSSGRRRAPVGVLRHARLTRRPRLLPIPARARHGHRAALRQLGNRLVGFPHGCLKTGSTYDETTAWAHLQPNT